METSSRPPQTSGPYRKPHRQPRWTTLIGLFLFSVTGLIPLAAEAQIQLTVEIQENHRALLNWTAAPQPSLYTVESLDELSGRWRAVPPASQWPIDATTYLDPRVTFLPSQRFYRISARALPQPVRGKLLSYEKLDTMTFEEVEELIETVGVTAITPESGVSYYYVRYETVDSNGRGAVASGGLVLPTDIDEPLPVLSFQHNSDLERNNVPSRFTFTSFNSILPVLLGSTGFATVAADFPGLGDSDDQRAFMVAAPNVTSVIDLLTAAQEIADIENQELLPELYLTGYGEGGYITLATQQVIEADPESPFTVVASAPLAPFSDLSGILLDRLLDPDQDYPNPYILASLLVSHNQHQPFYTDASEVFQPGIVERVLSRIEDRDASGPVLNSLIEFSRPRDMLQPDFLAALEADPDHPFRVSLAANDVYDWTPQGEIRIYHCSADDTAPVSASEQAVSTWETNGAGAVDLVDPLPVLNHRDCHDISALSATTWIGSRR